jgi:hypothetical protein
MFRLINSETMVPDTTHSRWTRTDSKKENLSEGLVFIHSGENEAATRSIHKSYNIVASFIIHQLAEQFWSVNLVTAAFGVQIPNISN